MLDSQQQSRPRTTQPRLFDAHCHLQDPRLAAQGPLDALIEEAAAAGVHQLACNGCWQEDWGHVAAAAAAHPQAVLANFGLVRGVGGEAWLMGLFELR